ncbi:MAG: CoA transferase, partial [Chloroflexi bacterium]|nr:CoA transferase [Chloroflexota bacterium]
NKKSVTVNLKSEEGREIIYKLAQTSDVAVENFRPGVAQELRVDYETLSRYNPRLVYCSISAFGQQGPYRHKPAFDPIIQGYTGILSLTGESDGPPAMAGVPVADITGGIVSAFAILVGVYESRRSGQGQKIEVCLLDVAAGVLGPAASDYLVAGAVPKRMGSGRGTGSVPYQAVRTQDGHITIAATQPHFWTALCQAIGRPDLIDHPHFATDQARIQHRQEVIAALEEALTQHPSSYWLPILDKASVPSGPVSNLEQVFQDPQVLHNQMLVTAEHPVAGTVKMVGIPVKLSRTPGQIRSAAPLLGQHTDEVLQSLGYSPQQIQELRQRGAV